MTATTAVAARRRGPTRRCRAAARGAVAALALTASAAAGLAACSPSVKVHGHRLDQDALARIEPGRTTQDEVARLLGSPSAVGTFDGDAWYYVSQRKEVKSFYQNDVVAQDVVTVTFDDQGVVAAVDRHGLEQARHIEPVERETPTAGNDLGLIEQLVGNVGRFDERPADQGPPGMPGRR